MPIFDTKRFARPETLRQIDSNNLLKLLRRYRRFFADHGMELPACKKGHPKFDLDFLSQILASPDSRPPQELADALFYINAMSTAEGMDALLPELNGRQFRLDAEFSAPADVALRAWLKDPELVQRKHAEIFATRPRRFEYFHGAAHPPLPLPQLTDDRLARLEGYLDETFFAKGRGRGAKVLPCPGEYECMFLVRHGDPHRREGALDGGQETSVFYRPLRFDVVGYDSESGILRVHAKSTWEKSLYRNGFGRFLFDALDHFPDSGCYTLEPLRSGAGCLACGETPPMKCVNLSELHLRLPGAEGGLLIHRCSDVLASMRRHKQEIPPNARLEQATFDVFVFGERQPHRVTIVPPRIARYSDESDNRMMKEWLMLRGFIHGRTGAINESEATLTLLPSH